MKKAKVEIRDSKTGNTLQEPFEVEFEEGAKYVLSLNMPESYGLPTDQDMQDFKTAFQDFLKSDSELLVFPIPVIITKIE